MFGVMMCFGFSVLSGMIFDIWMIVIFVVLVMIGLKLCVVLWYMRLFQWLFLYVFISVKLVWIGVLNMYGLLLIMCVFLFFVSLVLQFVGVKNLLMLVFVVWMCFVRLFCGMSFSLILFVWYSVLNICELFWCGNEQMILCIFFVFSSVVRFVLLLFVLLLMIVRLCVFCLISVLISLDGMLVVLKLLIMIVVLLWMLVIVD